MIQLLTLGSVDLRAADGQEVRPILTQPKRLALLSYLAVASPTGFHRRDELLGIFWPDLDDARARAALSRAIHYLRRALGDGVIVSRGDADLGLDPSSVACDVVRFEKAVAARRHDEALALYRGDFLVGFFLSEAPAFEQWVENERARMKSLAARAASGLADSEEAAGNLVSAQRRAQRAIELAPYDEAGVRRHLSLLDRAGDRAGAVRAYDEFARRISADLELTPAPETVALVEAIRARSAANGSADHSVSEADTFRVSAEPPPVMEVPPPRARAKAARTHNVAVVAGLIVLALAVSAALLLSSGPLPRDRVVVVHFANQTGDTSLDPLGALAADLITQNLARTGLVPSIAPAIASGRRGEDLENASRLATIAKLARAGTVVGGAFYRDGDSLRFTARVVDLSRRNAVWVLPPITTTTGANRQAIEEMAQRATGAVAALTDPRFSSWFHLATPPPTFDAFQEFVRGIDLQLRYDTRVALTHFDRAIALDSTFTWARMHVAAAYLNLHEASNADSVAEMVNDRREQLTPLGRHWLDWLQATRAEDHVGAYRAMRKAAALAPECFLYNLASSARLINRPREALEALEKLGPNSPYNGGSIIYWDVLTRVLHQLGEHDRELSAARDAQRLHPDNIQPLGFEIRALAALGRIEEVRARIDALLPFTREASRHVDLPALKGKTPALVMIEAALELRTHRHDAAADEALAQAIAWHRARPTAEARTPARRSELGHALYLAGRWDEAESIFRELEAEQPNDVVVVGFLGVIAAKRGDRDRAEQLLDRLEQMKRIAARPHQQTSYWQAKITAVLGDRQRAVQHIVDLVGEQGRFAHPDADLESLRGYPRFEELIRPKG